MQTASLIFGLFNIDYTGDRGQRNFDRIVTRDAEAFKFIIKESFGRDDRKNVATSAISKAIQRFGQLLVMARKSLAVIRFREI